VKEKKKEQNTANIHIIIINILLYEYGHIYIYIPHTTYTTSIANITVPVLPGYPVPVYRYVENRSVLVLQLAAAWVVGVVYS